jgi:mutator family transposase
MDPGGSLGRAVGTIGLQIPKLSQGSYFPAWLLEPRRRVEKALTAVVAEAYVLGVSTRKVEDLVQAPRDRAPLEEPGLPAREGARRRGAHPVTHLLLASDLAWRDGEGNPGALRTRQPDDDAAEHTPEPRCERERDSVARARRPGREARRDRGEQHCVR